MLDLPNALYSKRCVVRPYRAGDGALLFEAVEASREHLLGTMPWAHNAQSREETELLVRTFHRNWVSRDPDIPLGIFNLSEDRQIGATGLHRIDWERRFFEIGYWIRPDEEGKGLMTEAVRRVVDFAFDDLGANRVHIRCNVDNVRSANVARRLGFVEEGRLLNAGVKPDGSFIDHLSFGMTPTLWPEMP